MVQHQSKAQQESVARVMHEFKHGELRTGENGPKVKDRKQAVAIALREAGSSNQESESHNRSNLRKTKAKERKGDSAEAAREGKAAQDHTMNHATSRDLSRRGPTRDDLYAEAMLKKLPGRSKMSKAELKRALHT